MALEKPPVEFVEKLEREFPGYRIRWSQATSRWNLEQKIGRAADLEQAAVIDDPFDDNWIRARDGYWLIMEIAPGTTTKCPDCGFELKLAENRAKEVLCGYCRSRGEEGVHWIYFFHLGEVLLDHLRKTDPRRGMTKAIVQRADRINKALIADRIRKRDNIVEEQMKGNFTQLFQIPTVGLTGKTSAWENAPDSKLVKVAE